MIEPLLYDTNSKTKIFKLLQDENSKSHGKSSIDAYWLAHVPICNCLVGGEIH